MEQHPVPRNITGFQFRLVGDMTLKQFGYLLAGGILGIIFIKLPFPYFISWPLGIAFFAAGAAFAFVPIQERPLDRWFLAFIRSVYSPTQFIWRKQNPPPAILTAKLVKKKQQKDTAKLVNHYSQSRKKLKAYLRTLPKSAAESTDKRERKQIQNILTLFSTPTASTTQLATSSINQSIKKPSEPSMKKPPVKKPTEKVVIKPSQPPPVTKETKQPNHQTTATIANKTKKLTEQIGQLKKELAGEKTDQHRVKELEAQIAQLLNEKDALLRELTELKEKLASKKEVVRPTVFKEEKPQKETVKIITPKVAKSEGFPSIPQVPNIISGIVKDNSGTLLPNILVTIRDSNGTPVRALKTNKLGQFAASTPLSAGTYTIECEDPKKKFSFAIIEITLTDDLVTPLEILAKSEKDVKREKLMKEIFGEDYQKKTTNNQQINTNR